jgi:hypothetical protein
LKKLSSSAERPLLLSVSDLLGDGEVLTADGAAGGALRKLLKISSPPELPVPLDDNVPTGVSVIKIPISLYHLILQCGIIFTVH